MAQPVASWLRALAAERAAIDAADTKLLAVDTRSLDDHLDRDSRDRLVAPY